MSQFTTPLILQHLPDEQWQVWEAFEYHVGEYPSDQVITVPAGYVTDMASVPRLFWSLLPPFGRYGKAAVLHDWLYANAIGSKDWADQVFLEAMEVLGVAKWKRIVMYSAAQIFGRGSYGE